MHSENTASPIAAAAQVLDRLPNGELAWLRPETPPADSDQDPRYVLTDLGRRELAMDRLFGRGPTVAEVQARADVGTCSSVA